MYSVDSTMTAVSNLKIDQFGQIFDFCLYCRLAQDILPVPLLVKTMGAFSHILLVVVLPVFTLAFEQHHDVINTIELTSWSTGFCSGVSSVQRVPVGKCVDASAYFFPGIWATFSYSQSTSTRAVMTAPFFTDPKCSSLAQGVDAALENTCYPLTTSAPWLFGGYYDVNVSAGTATGKLNCTDNQCNNCAESVSVQGVGNQCVVLGYGLGGQDLYATFSSFAFTDSLIDTVWYNDSSCEYSITSMIQVPLNQCFGAASARV